jgi:ABC-type polysaccharide/polyol phosphate transport system ATPase subunit
MSENAIDIKNLTVKYRNFKKYSIKKSLFRLKRVKFEDLLAVEDVSFEVIKGEILGIIGKNGSGKSTLLRTIAGIFSADEGTIDLHNQSISLLSIGVGFQKELTGRDNIYLSGMLLGFSEEFIKSKEEQIIGFSELGKFIDKPVKTYSSGMYSKLAFSITAILETEIMLIDEVFSVGDQRFKRKSYEKMKNLISKHDKTVVIVSHSLNTLEELCDRIVWMHEGKIIKIGEPKDIISEYREFMSS